MKHKTMFEWGITPIMMLVCILGYEPKKKGFNANMRCKFKKKKVIMN
jgi:hypothetical protein